MAKVLGIDYGEKRIGLALSTDDKRMAYIHGTIQNSNSRDVINEFKKICQEEEVESLVVGLPLDQAGQPGAQAEIVKKFSKMIGEETGLPYYFEDERFSTALASKMNKEAGLSVKKTRQTIDSQSAQIILQTYLDRKYG